MFSTGGTGLYNGQSISICKHQNLHLEKNKDERSSIMNIIRTNARNCLGKRVCPCLLPSSSGWPPTIFRRGCDSNDIPRLKIELFVNTPLHPSNSSTIVGDERSFGFHERDWYRGSGVDKEEAFKEREREKKGKRRSDGPTWRAGSASHDSVMVHSHSSGHLVDAPHIAGGGHSHGPWNHPYHHSSHPMPPPHQHRNLGGHYDSPLPSARIRNLCLFTIHRSRRHRRSICTQISCALHRPSTRPNILACERWYRNSRSRRLRVLSSVHCIRQTFILLMARGYLHQP
jgi:hypothetical protein